ncbi:kinase [Actinomyces oris]|uniref:serine/threonine-protein kinase n=1 Tax=Actinomyces TaxID=1654 RepID=UPI00094D600C|nr:MULTISPECIES: serine/threonine-protein kinase [Actinomyces]OLO64213.1 kinase [Actinomyces oris]
MVTVKLEQHVWEVGDKLGAGGYGSVREAWRDGVERAVAKFVSIKPGAQRELLIGASTNLPHVVPVLDSGEHEGMYVLIMPRAEYSLRQYITDNVLSLEEKIAILSDVAHGLKEIQQADLVHRDLKPDNVLYTDGVWQLCDFGIARYRDASTSVATRKFSFTAPYASPEQWRNERATPSTDIYAFGVMAYELLEGHLPFQGQTAEALREQHLHTTPPDMSIEVPRLQVMVEQCLYKAAEARPTADWVLQQLAHAADAPASPGVQQLQQVSQQYSALRSQAFAEDEQRKTLLERRKELFQYACQSFEHLRATVQNTIVDNAPLAKTEQRDEQTNLGDKITISSVTLAAARLEFVGPRIIQPERWNGPFEVIACASIELQQISTHNDYPGRSHSLWYCDALQEGRFEWFELAFMNWRNHQRMVPYAAQPEEISIAFEGMFGSTQLAWPLEQLDRADPQEFVDRWIGWFAEASDSKLFRPSTMPEKPVKRNWRGA